MSVVNRHALSDLHSQHTFKLSGSAQPHPRLEKPLKDSKKDRNKKWEPSSVGKLAHQAESSHVSFRVIESASTPVSGRKSTWYRLGYQQPPLFKWTVTASNLH